MLIAKYLGVQCRMQTISEQTEQVWTPSGIRPFGGAWGRPDRFDPIRTAGVRMPWPSYACGFEFRGAGDSNLAVSLKV